MAGFVRGELCFWLNLSPRHEGTIVAIATGGGKPPSPAYGGYSPRYTGEKATCCYRKGAEAPASITDLPISSLSP